MDNKIMTAPEWVDLKEERRMNFLDNPYQCMQQYAEYVARETAVLFGYWMKKKGCVITHTLPQDLYHLFANEIMKKG